MGQFDLRNVYVASPCHESWERMVGDERVRHCDSCQLNVYNFSEMSAAEIASLVSKTQGRVCGRMYRRADGTILTRDCPVGLRAVRLRVAKFAGAVFATVVSFLTITSAQTKDNQGQQNSGWRVEQVIHQTDKLGSISGTVTDYGGAVIAGADISVKLKSTRREQMIKTNDLGFFLLGELEEGVYSITISVAGFKRFTVEEFPIKVGESYVTRINLSVGAPLTGAVAVLSDQQPIISDGMMITDRQLLKTQSIQELPELHRSRLPMLGLIAGIESNDSKPPKKGFKKQR